MPLQEALFKARQKRLDLVEVAENAKPPVVKIIDFKKFKYQQSKKEQASKKKSKSQETKQFRLTPFIAKGDFETRIKRAKEELKDGNKVKLAVRFVGRQITRKEFGKQLIDKAIKKLASVSKVEQPPKWQGRMLVTLLKPVQVKKIIK